MKNIAAILTTAVWALVLATACDKSETNVQVSGVELDRKTLTLTVGDDPTATLTATVAPTGATNKAVKWRSADETVATVDADGRVTAVADGETEITVTTRDGGKEATCTVTVGGETVNPDLVNLLDLQYIPDAGFLEYCEGQMEVWDTDGYDGLSSDEAAAVKTMSIADVGAVRSLRGIEHFTGLQTLELRNLNNNLTVLDLTKNAALRKLVCTGASLTELNVSGCAALETLDVSGCTGLKSLACYGNVLTTLDVSKCVVLTSLNVEDNRLLTKLDVSKNTALTDLYAAGNALTELDVSRNAALKSLDVSRNAELKSLDVSNNPSLTILRCSNNDLTALNVSNNPLLTILRCSNNGLTALDGISKCTLLTDLYCDDNNLKELDVSNCAALETLNVSWNTDMKSLDVLGCVALKTLACAGNGLTALDVSNCAALTDLDGGDNELSALTVGAEEYGGLSYFDCRNNELGTAALDAIFGALPYVPGGPEVSPNHTINISGNPGAKEKDYTEIALAKNWTVVKDLLRKR